MVDFIGEPLVDKIVMNGRGSRVEVQPIWICISRRAVTTIATDSKLKLTVAISPPTWRIRRVHGGDDKLWKSKRFLCEPPAFSLIRKERMGIYVLVPSTSKSPPKLKLLQKNCRWNNVPRSLDFSFSWPLELLDPFHQRPNKNIARKREKLVHCEY